MFIGIKLNSPLLHPEGTNTPNTQPRYHPTYSRFDEKNVANLSNNKEAELMWGKIHTKLGSRNNEFPYARALHDKKDQFKAIYFQAKSLFNDKNRSDGSPYFYHLLETAYILIDEAVLGNLEVVDIFVALLHDIIEDTHHNYESLWKGLSYKGKEIAFGVHIISKTSFNTEIRDLEERESYEACMSEIDDENIDLSGNIIDEDVVDPEVVKKYNKIKEVYKSIRNEKHFKNYTSYNNFFQYAKDEACALSFKCTDELLDTICKRSINVKLADRLHNLRTISHLSEFSIIKKTRETRKYLLGIAEEINPIMANKLREQIDTLENEVAIRLMSDVVCGVKDDTSRQLQQT